jgi:hypothetical protein
MKRVLKANWIVSEGDQANGGKKSLVMKWTVETVPEGPRFPNALSNDRLHWRGIERPMIASPSLPWRADAPPRVP